MNSDEVKIEGRFHLPLAPAAASSAQQPNANLAQPCVIIVENHPDHAIMEITCSCGAKSYVRCEYDNPQSADPVNPQSKTNEEHQNAN